MLRVDTVLVLVAACWGASFVVIKDALGQVGPHALLFARFSVAAAVLVALFPRTLLRLDRATLAVGLALGALLWMGFALQTLGLVYTTPAKSAFLTALYVPMTPLLVRVLHGTRLSRPVVVSVLLATLGLALLTRPDAPGGFNPGDLLSVGSAGAFALHIVALDRWAARLPARLLAIVQLGAVAAISWPLALASTDEPVVPTLPLALAVLYLALVCSAFAYVAQTWAQRQMPPTRVAVIFALESVFAATFSVAVFGERLALTEWLGGGLVVLGVLVGGPGGRGGASGAPSGARVGSPPEGRSPSRG